MMRRRALGLLLAAAAAEDWPRLLENGATSRASGTRVRANSARELVAAGSEHVFTLCHAQRIFASSARADQR